MAILETAPLILLTFACKKRLKFRDSEGMLSKMG